ncbi:MAG TPA: magnesium/cobalt transporter CorA [candidate division Zixibacteria bacterium]|nr:magnesium/cobalt transporter CorA [candidate division Zixibacteria bacterium]
MIQSFLYVPDKGVTAHEGIGDFDAWIEQPNALLWVDMCKPTDEESFVLTNDFKFHPLAIEDVISERPRTKLDDYLRYLFLVFQLVDYIGRDEGLRVSEVDLFLSKNSLVTVHYDDHRIWDYLYARAERDDRLMMRGVDFLFHAVIDTIVDNFNTTLDILEYDIDQLEDDVLAEPDEDTVRSIYTLRRDIQHLKRVVLPQREVVSQLSRGHHSLISSTATVYFSDIYDHLVRINDIADSHRDTLNSALEVYFSAVSTKTNQVIKILTIFTVVFIPPTFLVGLWGMNFINMPELNWENGYFYSLVFMLAIVLGLILFFRKKKWL